MYFGPLISHVERFKELYTALDFSPGTGFYMISDSIRVQATMHLLEFETRHGYFSQEKEGGGLFQKGEFTLNSGKKSDFKVECDCLTDNDIDTLAYLISQKMKFSKAVGVPKGGCRLADALEKYAGGEDSPLPVLIVDDVLTTGGSMERLRATIEGGSIGVVIFARGQCPSWVIPVFQMWT